MQWLLPKLTVALQAGRPEEASRLISKARGVVFSTDEVMELLQAALQLDPTGTACLEVLELLPRFGSESAVSSLGNQQVLQLLRCASPLVGQRVKHTLVNSIGWSIISAHDKLDGVLPLLLPWLEPMECKQCLQAANLPAETAAALADFVSRLWAAEELSHLAECGCWAQLQAGSQVRCCPAASGPMSFWQQCAAVQLSKVLLPAPSSPAPEHATCCTAQPASATTATLATCMQQSPHKAQNGSSVKSVGYSTVQSSRAARTAGDVGPVSCPALDSPARQQQLQQGVGRALSCSVLALLQPPEDLSQQSQTDVMYELNPSGSIGSPPGSAASASAALAAATAAAAAGHDELGRGELEAAAAANLVAVWAAGSSSSAIGPVSAAPAAAGSGRRSAASLSRSNQELPALQHHQQQQGMSAPGSLNAALQVARQQQAGCASGSAFFNIETSSICTVSSTAHGSAQVSADGQLLTAPGASAAAIVAPAGAASRALVATAISEQQGEEDAAGVDVSNKVEAAEPTVRHPSAVQGVPGACALFSGYSVEQPLPQGAGPARTAAAFYSSYGGDRPLPQSAGLASTTPTFFSCHGGDRLLLHGAGSASTTAAFYSSYGGDQLLLQGARSANTAAAFYRPYGVDQPLQQAADPAVAPPASSAPVEAAASKPAAVTELTVPAAEVEAGTAPAAAEDEKDAGGPAAGAAHGAGELVVDAQLDPLLKSMLQKEQQQQQQQQVEGEAVLAGGVLDSLGAAGSSAAVASAAVQHLSHRAAPVHTSEVWWPSTAVPQAMAAIALMALCIAWAVLAPSMTFLTAP
uniref:Uncharacterized protein n=1 Tax=Tetradesmus obliquus TaxID=3088 RepID=A0A383WM38_TETOB|eukprot:jgi/Sobl393_1/19055/SZX77796.1